MALENVSPLLAPDRDAMLAHLTFVFGRAPGGRIEVTAIKAVTEKVAPRTRFFDLTELEAAAEWAAQVNAEHLWNVYIGAATRRPDVFPGMAASDEDFFLTMNLWADADTEADVMRCATTYHACGLPPALVVVTGRTPERRAQFWWPLQEPLTDIDVLRGTLRGMADGLGTDHMVLTGKQLMRLGGSLAWPKPNKVGRVLERTEVVFPGPGAWAPVLPLEALQRAFPVVSSPANPRAGIELTSYVGGSSLGQLGMPAEVITDGREGYAFRLVRATLRDFVRDHGAFPSPQELYEEVAPTYFAHTDQTRPGRGVDFLAMKVAETCRALHQGQIPGMESLEIAVADTYRVGRVVQCEPPSDQPDMADDFTPTLYEVLTMADIKALPDPEWIIEDVIPEGGLGFVYGAPGSYKTFVCYDLALHLAYGLQSWLDKPIRASGGVLYLATEGARSFKHRITAWQMKNGVADDTSQFRLIRQSINFMDKADIARLERTVEATVARDGPISVVFVDTVSRVLPGADENLQKDMTIFVAACDRIRERFGATVIGVHHANAGGHMRGSSVFGGAGDVIFKVEKTEGQRAGVLTCEKQKEAEDGWKQGFAAEVVAWMPRGSLKEASSLVVAFAGPVQPDAPDAVKWPPREVSRDVQRSINEAWMRGRPLSPHPRSQTEGRYVVDNIMKSHGLPRKVVQMMINEWLASETLSFETLDSHSKAKGLRVLRWVD